MLWELYMQAVQLRTELEFQLRHLRIADADHPKCIARDELSLFIHDYEHMTAKWADGFNAVQDAQDVLEVTL